MRYNIFKTLSILGNYVGIFFVGLFALMSTRNVGTSFGLGGIMIILIAIKFFKGDLEIKAAKSENPYVFHIFKGCVRLIYIALLLFVFKYLVNEFDAVNQFLTLLMTSLIIGTIGRVGMMKTEKEG